MPSTDTMPPSRTCLRWLQVIHTLLLIATVLLCIIWVLQSIQIEAVVGMVGASAALTAQFTHR